MEMSYYILLALFSILYRKRKDLCLVFAYLNLTLGDEAQGEVFILLRFCLGWKIHNVNWLELEGRKP